MPAGIDPQTRFNILVRIRPEASLGAASGELDSFVRHIIRDHPEVGPRDAADAVMRPLQ